MYEVEWVLNVLKIVIHIMESFFMVKLMGMGDIHGLTERVLKVNG